MGLKSRLASSLNVLKSASKPGWSEFWLLFRVCILGIAVLGAIGFLIRYVFAIIGLFTG
ncbi:MAG: SecE/sec61-gamma family protein translocase subunit [Candidatus Hecatellaceae archaeon]